MSFRKIFPCIFLFFAGAILGRPLALGSLGLFVKTVLYFDKGWDFQYGSVDWHKGKICFSDAKIEQNKIFSLHSPRMSLHFSKKHLEFDQPQLIFLDLPESTTGSDWTLSMQQGTIEGLGFKKALFSFEKLLPSELGRLTLEWEKSQVSFEAIQQGNELWLQTELKNFDLCLCEKGMGAQGVLNGGCHLVFEANEWKRGSAHLNLDNLGYGELFSRVDGTIDWEGDGVPLSFTSASDLRKVFENREERLRVVLTNGILHGPSVDLRELKGDLSFKSGLGIKWEFEAGVDSASTCNWHGRAFLHEERAHWIESELLIRDSIVKIRGEEILAKIIWEAEWEKIGVFELAFIQPFLAPIASYWTQWKPLQGELSGKAKLIASPDEKYAWDFSYQAKDFGFRQNHLEVGCKSSEGQFSSNGSGKFGFAEAFFSFRENLQGKKWEGKAEIESGRLIDSHFEGEIQGVAAALVANGSLDEFFLGCKTETAQLVLQGAATISGVQMVIQKGEIEGISFSGAGEINDELAFSFHINQFKGPLSPLFNKLDWPIPIEGITVSTGFGLYVSGSPDGLDWSCQTRGSFYHTSQDQIFPFYCPLLEKKGEELHFDFRVEGTNWDLIRLCGKSNSLSEFCLDPQRSHVLGEPLELTASLDEKGVNSISLRVDWQTDSLPLLASLLKKQQDFFFSNPLSGAALFSFDYKRDSGSSLSLKGKNLSWQEAPINLDVLAQGNGSNWELLRCQTADLFLLGKIAFNDDVFRVHEGVIHSNRGLDSCFDGYIDTNLQSELHLSHVHLDLSSLKALTQYLKIPFAPLEGNVEGEGCIVWKEKLEADFDFTASRLKAGSFEWENRGPLHFYYSSLEGISFSGIDFWQAEVKGISLPDFNSKVELFGYDPSCSLWFLNGAHVHLGLAFLEKIPEFNFLHGFNLDQDIDFFADFCGSRDFSKIACCMQEGLIPIGGAIRHLKDLTLCFTGEELWAHCNYSHQGHPLRLHLDVDLDPAFSGKLTFESVEDPISQDQLPLTIYWSHSLDKGLSVKEIEGAFSGLEASFHAIDEEASLIGSARFDCSRFVKMVPPEIAELFTDLKMGKGYELKGRLSLPKGAPSFSGLLSGKQFDLFGYQLRTLLARIDLSPDKVDVFDLKISDSAAILKIEKVIAESLHSQPWTIDIPELAMLELRPSLLQKSGESPGFISPLVVREFKLHNLRGLLDDSKTYTAQGELSFINSYRREHTVFDIPADLLGRIVGLDLELLIPACGDLSYEIKEGKFFLKELKNAYSEGKRSEFFLVPTDPVPTMDFDGNLQILVKCKQFVLFKFMESFMISIEGELNDPKFHLQKKRRFWNL